MFRAMSGFANARKRMLEKVLAGLNRADELGGEVRDFVVERVLEDDRYITARKRIAALRGNEYVSRAEAAAAEKDREETAARAAPPPAASVAPKADVLGDPGLQIQVYGRESCPWSGRAVRLLEDLKIDYDFVDLDDSDHEHFMPRLIAETKQNTVPFIYVRGAFVGGFNALDEIHRAGTLEYLILTPEEREHANPALAKVVVTPRPNSDEVAPGEA